MYNYSCIKNQESYNTWIGKLVKSNIKHVTSKFEICLVKSYNSVLLYYLAMLPQKTKCYSKSIQMLESSIALVLPGKFFAC